MFELFSVYISRQYGNMYLGRGGHKKVFSKILVKNIILIKIITQNVMLIPMVRSVFNFNKYIYVIS